MGRVLVTGGTGFLGSHIVSLLTRRGERVRVLARPRSPLTLLAAMNVEIVRGDVTDALAVRAALRGCDHVYHVAGHNDHRYGSAATTYGTNVIGTANVCAAARAEGVMRLVHTSSINAVGYGTLDSPADEASPWTFAGMGLPYPNSKRTAEAVVHAWIRRGLRAVIVNPSFLVGPGDIKPTSGRLILNVAARVPFYPSGGNNFIDVRDAARGHLLAMEHGRVGERYILGHRNMIYRQFASMVADILGTQAPRWRTPYGLGLLAGLGSDIYGRLTGTPGPTSGAEIRFASLGNYVTAAKAIRVLRLPQSPLEQAVRDACAWFRSWGYISPHRDLRVQRRTARAGFCSRSPTT